MGAITLNAVCKSYDGQPACRDISLAIRAGEFFTLLGPSGCGKTTLLRMIAGFIAPDSGSIHLDGLDLTGVKAERRNIGMVFQNYALFPFMTVRENVEYGLRIQKRPPAECRERADRYLHMAGLGDLAGRNVDALSGGEQQRVALARSLAVEPAVLLLDEPLSNLDARLRDHMRDELRTLQRRLGITTIFVTHDQKEALALSDRMAVFNQGRCIQVGPPATLYGQPATSFVATFLGDTNLFPVTRRGSGLFLGDRLPLECALPQDCRHISLRPQDILLSPATETAGAGDISLPGRIVSSQFHGHATDYEIMVDEIRFRVSRFTQAADHHRYEVGQEVRLHFAASSMHPLPA